MTALDLLVSLRRRGIALQAVVTRLRYWPADALAEPERAVLAAYKPALLPLITELAALEQDGTAAGLRYLWAGLAEPYRARLLAEAEDGDSGAVLILAVGASVPVPAAPAPAELGLQ